MTQTCDYATECTTCDGKAPCTMADYPTIDSFASGITPHGVVKRYIKGSNAWDFELNGSNGTDTNPFVFLFSGIFNLGNSRATPGPYDDKTWGKGYNTTLSSIVLICSMTTADIEVQYSSVNSTFSINSLAPTTNNGTIRAVSSVVDMQQSPYQQFFDALEPLASASFKVEPTTGAFISIPDVFINSFEKTFGLTYLPFAHSAFTTTSAADTSVEHELRGTAVNIIWLIIYMILLAVFAGLAAYQAIMSTKVHVEAKWRERKEENKHEESGTKEKETEKGKGVGEKDATKGTAESFTDPIAMTFDDSDKKKVEGKDGKEKKSEDGTFFGVSASDSMASLTAAMNGKTFGQSSK